MNKNIFKSLPPMLDGGCGGLDYMRCGDNQYVCVPGGFPTKTIACSKPDLHQNCGVKAGKCDDITAAEWTQDEITKFKGLLQHEKLTYFNNRSLGKYIDKNKKYKKYKEEIFNCIIEKCGNMSYDEAKKNIFESTDYKHIINRCLYNSQNKDEDENEDEENDEEKDENEDEENDEEKDENEDEENDENEDDDNKQQRVLTIKKKLEELQKTDSTYFLEIQNKCQDVDIVSSIEKNINSGDYKKIKYGNKQDLKNITDKLLEICINDNTNEEETLDPSFIKKDNKLSLLSLIFIIIGVIIFIIACILFIKRSKKVNKKVGL
jgi:hypothetical protein